MRYLLLATLGTALFFGGYWLLMRRETRHTMVRAYLVGTLLLALLLPVFHLRLTLPTHYEASAEPSDALVVWQSTPESNSMTGFMTNEGMMQVTYQQDGTGVRHLSVASTAPEVRTPLWKQVLPWVWLAGCVAMLALLVVRLVKLHRRLRALPCTGEEGVRISLLDDDTPAFSFGRHIVVGCKGFSESEVRQLIGHEMVHVRQAHTADLLLCQLVQVLLWFNPFVWLYGRELKRVHEYIADSEMLRADGAADYAELFYHQVSGKVYSPLGNTFDYGMVHRRIGMMQQARSRRGWMKPLVLVPLVALLLVAGCTPKGSLKGFYTVESMTLMSDNPAEPALQCSEFLGLENRLFAFHRDGRMDLLAKDSNGYKQQLTYKLDTSGIHFYDSTGHPWMEMAIETLHCDKDSIVLRFIDPDPVGGLGKMLRGLPSYRYKIDTVEVSTSGKGPNGEPIEVNPHKEVDTTFAHINVPCPMNNNNDWFRGNRLLGASMSTFATCARQTVDRPGYMYIESYTQWEFRNNDVAPDARQRYDTASCYNPRMEGDRFILEVTLRKQ